MLAMKLDCSLSAIHKTLKQPGWEYVKEAFEDEKLMALGQCEKNIFIIADCSLDTASRLSANKFLLEKLHPDFHPQSKLVIEGGNNPLKVQHVVFQIPADILNRPVEDRMAVLEQIEEKEKEMRANDDNG